MILVFHMNIQAPNKKTERIDLVMDEQNMFKKREREREREP